MLGTKNFIIEETLVNKNKLSRITSTLKTNIFVYFWYKHVFFIICYVEEVLDDKNLISRTSSPIEKHNRPTEVKYPG